MIDLCKCLPRACILQHICACPRIHVPFPKGPPRSRDLPAKRVVRDRGTSRTTHEHVRATVCALRRKAWLCEGIVESLDPDRLLHFSPFHFLLAVHSTHHGSKCSRGHGGVWWADRWAPMAMKARWNVQAAAVPTLNDQISWGSVGFTVRKQKRTVTDLHYC